MKLTNKTILITGGASGIGLSLATALSRQNTVIIAGRGLHKLEEAKETVPDLIIHTCDVSDPASIDLLFQKLKEHGIVLDVVFNNAVIKHITANSLEYAPSANAVVLNFIRRFLPKSGLKLIDKMSRKQLLG